MESRKSKLWRKKKLRKSKVDNKKKSKEVKSKREEGEGRIRENVVKGKKWRWEGKEGSLRKKEEKRETEERAEGGS